MGFFDFSIGVTVGSVTGPNFIMSLKVFKKTAGIGDRSLGREIRLQFVANNNTER